MRAGRYKVECVAARLQERGNKQQVVLVFVTEDGIELRKWYEIKKPLPAQSRYIEAVTLLNGREPTRGDNIDPEIFVGARFEAEVGWRYENDSESVTYKKDARDFLRVRELVKRVSGVGVADVLKIFPGGRVVKGR